MIKSGIKSFETCRKKTLGSYSENTSWYLSLSEQGSKPSVEQIERAYQDVKAAIPLHSSRNRIVLRRFATAAAIILIAAAAVYMFRPAQSAPDAVVKTGLNEQPLERDALPGGNRATLTLSDGSAIDLDGANSGELASQGGTGINKTEQGKLVYASDGYPVASTEVLYNSIRTPRGGQYQVTLPDGTKVWLNAASSLRFPTRFAGDIRKVSLSGEAYFEVSEDKQRPFVVTVNDSEVEVLGTHFNILSYEDEVLTTTLLEGSVIFKHGGAERIIRPGQAAKLHKDIRVEEVNIADAVAWKDGVTAFSNADIYSIMRQISRWYDLDVVYQGKMPDRKFTGKIPRSARLSKVLKVLELSEINFRIDEKIIVVTP
jgi:transmembrane sensor